ncbi:energy transducer TonB family protein [Piscinibacter defluvii]|uniref:energy transducer TonB family protein n=1 Tax=Piscinibacter defluvii TaxID=1796922 RepID=UPI0035BFA350
MEPFAASVREALKWWRFVPAVDRSRCEPNRSTAAFAVWFEGTSDSPKVYFSFPKSADSVFRPSVLSIDAPTVRYPQKLIGIEGQVRVLRLIDPSGNVKSAAVRSSTPYGAFDSAVLKAARNTKVRWGDPAPSQDLCVEQTYQFCMSRRIDATAEFEACK